MAKARQTRRRKHRGGTQAGTVRPRGRRGAQRKPRSRAEARGTAEERRQERLSKPPTWRSAIQKGGIAAAALFGLIVIAFKGSVSAAIPLAILAAAIYIPAFFMTDSFLYRARMRKRERERAQQAEGTD